MKLHIVSLIQKEKQEIELILNKGSHPAVVIQRAQILLKAGRQLKDRTIAEHLDCTVEHVARIRRRYCKFGLKRAISDAPRKGRPVVFHQKEKAKIVAIACTKAPKGYSHWTLDLLVKEVTEREKIPISRTKIAVILRENDLKPWREKNVVYPKVNG